jgi:hypothetical protein
MFFRQMSARTNEDDRKEMAEYLSAVGHEPKSYRPEGESNLPGDSA